MTDYCDDCLDVMDDRYSGAVTCIGGTIYGFCSEDVCDGGCEDWGPCDCKCHEVAK